MERGIRRQAIYKEESDYQAFISILQSGLEKYGCILHAYCLMTNHFHMLLETSGTDISKFMKHLAGCYARYFNQKYMYQGHLFEGRYKSILVKDDTYFLQTSRYIHLNPVKAGMVENPEDYPWSSYRTILGMNPCPCGYYPGPKCRCTDYEIIKYRGKISGPIMDRIDIQKSVHPVSFFGVGNEKSSVSSVEIREKVERARRIQQKRYVKQEGINKRILYSG